MKRHWLRGMLLGVSLALLLAGGVALAATLSITPVIRCAQCEGEPAGALWSAETSGIDLNYQLCQQFSGSEGALLEWCQMPSADTEQWYVWLICGAGGQASVTGPQVTFESETNLQQVSEGTFTWRVYQVETGQSDETNVILSRDCAALEFVPEPGTIALLGSGLAGLAGYAALRWRARS